MSRVRTAKDPLAALHKGGQDLPVNRSRDGAHLRPYVGIAALALACAHGPMVATSIRIDVAPDTVTLVRTPLGAGFYASGIVHNDTDRPAYFRQSCGMYVEREVNGSWTVVWAPVCLSISVPLGTLLPHDSIVLAANVFGFTDPAFAPSLDPRLVAGNYRLLVGVGYAPNEARPRPSVPFVVRDSVQKH